MVRGDSVRDLYAKTLALLGLGVLAGTGALVDYWPVGLSTPAVDTPFVSSPLPGPLAVTAVDEPRLPTVTQSARARTARSTPRAQPESAAELAFLPVAGSSASRAGESPSPALLIATAAGPPLGAGVRLREPAGAVEPMPSLVPGAPDPNAPPLIIAANAEPPAGMPRARLAPTEAAPAGLTDEGDGLITGAFKKAGSSIVKTGAKTGASIFDTFRVVSSMVRRALPSD